MQLTTGTIIWTFCYLSVLIGLSAYGLHRYSIIYLFLKYRNQEPKPLREFETLPVVTVQLPIYNEFYVVERLLESVSLLDYPKESLQIQVLDDSTDETVELTQSRVDEMRREGWDISVVRRENRVGFKAGALEEGLKTARGEYIFILDADFVPIPDMLKKAIHFFTDPKIGMIQTRWGHINRTFSLLTRVQAMFLDGHLLLEQTARCRSGRFFNFNGTAGIWRKTCIVEAGGWQHDTLTEDLDLSYRAQMKGWRFVFLKDVVTPAELPVDMNGFKSQQHRWTKGSVQTCKKILPMLWRSDLPLVIKMEATAHLTSNFAYLLLAALCVLLHPTSSVQIPAWWHLLIVDIPIFVSASGSVALFYLCAQIHLHPKNWLREMLLLPLLLALGIGMSLNNAKAVLEAIFNQESGFERTPKYGIEKKGQRWNTARYIPIKSLLPIIELLFAGYFTWFVWEAVQRGQYMNLPFLMLFQIGFSYVALNSISQWIPRWSFGKRSEIAPLPA
ncbi:MAG TPA: cellulose synthase family protein [Chthoniobacterales bacterium]|jgi:cellulose synthase/poly-beta-1,6-N-acetylglucosamine synthase-like glycosyltransferase